MQGQTHPKGGRTAPSAGALHSLTLHLAVAGCERIEDGVHAYDPVEGALIRKPGLTAAPAEVQAACIGPSEWISGA